MSRNPLPETSDGKSSGKRPWKKHLVHRSKLGPCRPYLHADVFAEMFGRLPAQQCSLTASDPDAMTNLTNGAEAVAQRVAEAAATCGITLIASLPDGWITPLIARFASDARF